VGRRVSEQLPEGEGCPSATFEDLYRTQWAAMVRLAWLMTGSYEVAEDLVQDAFVRVESAWVGVETPAAYLRQAVVNGVRARARHLRVASGVVADPVRPVLSPELDEVWHLLGRLPLRQREALVLRFYADLKLADIAELLGCRLGTAKSLVHRGLRNMKELVEP
jgi:DNA-directed RNA polymerase specialized sigma24 family protein